MSTGNDLTLVPEPPMSPRGSKHFQRVEDGMSQLTTADLARSFNKSIREINKLRKRVEDLELTNPKRVDSVKI